MTTVHDAAAQGYQRAADAYIRGRPDYPAAITNWLTDTLEIGPDTKLLEIGAGTGKFTKLLTLTGAAIIALDPVPEMLTALHEALPMVTSVTAQAEKIPLDDQSVDVVICAQSFHWFANETALAEIKRVLRPGGRLGLIWNRRNQRIDWVAALTDIMRPYEGDAPRHDHGVWKDLFPVSGLTDLQLFEVPHGHTGPAEQVIIDRIMSVSFIAALDERTQQNVVEAIGELINSTPALAGQDRVTFPYVTAAYHAIRI
ncbi:MAG: class I SAM-dependent methyltransferase [Alphaproteobacteria bacterium]